VFREFAAGAYCLFRGFSFLTRSGVKRYVVIPLLINIVVFACALAIAAYRFGSWLHRCWTAGLPGWLAWLAPLLWLYSPQPPRSRVLLSLYAGGQPHRCAFQQLPLGPGGGAAHRPAAGERP
jgi:Uncharacterized protein involved in cysteine biosynthesis